MTHLGSKFEVSRSNCLGDTFTRNVTDARTDGRTDGSTLVRNEYTLFSKEKSGYKNEQMAPNVEVIHNMVKNDRHVTV